VPRESNHPTLDDLLQAAEMLESNRPLPPELEQALLRGTSIGGARPKALIDHDCEYFIAKFGSTTDVYPVVKAEYIGMRLAALSGLATAKVSLTSSLGKDVLMVERFDRIDSPTGKARRVMLSGLSLLDLHEMEARYASYSDLADRIRQRFDEPQATLVELFRRLIFNVLVGNTDDHARNHSAFWDGRQLSLTPAYDICPQLRTGQEATQAMDIGGVARNAAKLTNVLSVCGKFQLRESEARTMIEQLIALVNAASLRRTADRDHPPRVPRSRVVLERCRLREEARGVPVAYYNQDGVHSSLRGNTPAEVGGGSITPRADLASLRWQTHCRGLYQLPLAA